MTTLSRVTGKVFGGSAPLEEIGQFGSAKAGSLVNTQDVATIQQLPAYDKGWGSAIITSRNFPPIEEVTGVLKTISYQNCYLLQEGVPVYDVNTNYSATSIVKVVDGTNLSFYVSLVDNNIGNSLSDGTKWAKASFADRAIGEVVTSVIPLSDAGLHLLDGSVLSGSGSYAQFVSYIAGIYNSSLNYFCSEADWQSSVSTYGVCGKFVYDSVNNTVRLPKVTGFIEGASGASTLGNLTEAGLPNITGNIATDCNASNYNSGAFKGFGTTASIIQSASGGDTTAYVNTFDASQSNPIYSNSNTVQTQSVKVLYYIVVATSTRTNIQVDIDDIATDLNGKADVDLSNMNPTQTVKDTIITWGLPDYSNAITISSPYTAPSSGVITWQNSATTNCTVNGTTVYIGGNDNSNEGFVFLPVSEDDKVAFTVDSGVPRFIPFKGV